MRRLILVRHAKSAWNEPALEDFDRPLAGRGRDAADWIGKALADLGLTPDRIFCSTAHRTRETLDRILAAMPLPADAAVTYSRELYDLRDDDYLGFAAGQGGAADTLMLVGHNSATATTAVALVAERRRAALAPLLDFPTGGVAVFELDISAWSELRPRLGRLVHFLAPPKP